MAAVSAAWPWPWSARATRSARRRRRGSAPGSRDGRGIHGRHHAVGAVPRRGVFSRYAMRASPRFLDAPGLGGPGGAMAEGGGRHPGLTTGTLSLTRVLGPTPADHSARSGRARAADLAHWLLGPMPANHGARSGR